MKRLTLLCLGILLPLFALGAPVNQELCVTFDTDYDEPIPYGTWWTSDNIRPMRGVYLQACRWYAPTASWICPGGYTEDYGSDAGCITLPLDDSYTYRMRVHYKARVANRTIYVVDDTSDDESDVSYRVAHVEGSPWNYTPTGVTGEISPSWNRKHGVMLVAAWMMHRSSFGLSASGHPLKMVVDGSGQLYANPNFVSVDTDSKRSISHEVGHWIGMRRDENSYINYNDGVAADNCEGWGTGSDDLSKEWDSSAATEGWADFIAAWAWNTRNTDACALQRDRSTSPDWDLDNDPDSPGNINLSVENGQWGCEGNFEDFNSDGDFTDPGEAQWPGWLGTMPLDPPQSYTTNEDWLAAMVAAPDAKGCTGTLVGRSSKQDWVRFWWDMTTNGNLSPTTCASVLDLANPKNWDSTPNGGSPQSNDPIRRIESAADTLGYGNAFDNHKSNGLDHY